MATAKLTVSIKRRLGNGDEVFLAPGIEMTCEVGELDAKQAEVTERVNAWVETVLAAYPDPTDADEDEEEADEADDEEDADEEEADEDDEEGEELSEEDINGMSLVDLKKLVKEHELDLDLKGLKVKEAREAVIEALFSEDDEEEADDEEDDDEEDDDEAEDGEDYTEEELKAMKLEELQEICDTWEIGAPTFKKGAKPDLKTKKAAYVAHILEAQEAEE